MGRTTNRNWILRNLGVSDVVEPSDLTTYATQEDLQQAALGDINLDDYLTTSAASETYATKAELGDIDSILDSI